MTPQQNIKQSRELLDFYKTEYKKATGFPPVLNIVKDKWAARDLVDSFGIDECKDGILWYFRVSKRFDWKHFVNIADQCIEASKSQAADIQSRKKYKAIANEWRSK